MQLYMSWYIISFLAFYLYFLNIPFYQVQKSSIYVVFILFIMIAIRLFNVLLQM